MCRIRADCLSSSVPRQTHQPFADLESHDGGQHSLDDRGRDERQDTGRDAGDDGRFRDQAEKQHADHVIDYGAEHQPKDVAPFGAVKTLRAVPDRKRHKREGQQKAASRVDKVLESAGEAREHGSADRPEKQIGKRRDRALFCAEDDGGQRDREGLHRHRHAHRHGYGYLRHDRDDRGAQGDHCQILQGKL